MIPKLPSGFSHPMKIGGGAFASVYRVRQVSLDRWVAIKLIKENNHEKRKVLLKEAKTQAELHIPCIPQVFDAFEWHNNVCIIMQWIKGVDLNSILKTQLSDIQKTWLVGGVIGALASLHSKGYAHRDLKPANIIISPTDGIFLIDFGFTKHIKNGEKSISGYVKGTPAYIAPELWQINADVDLFRADIYALGKVINQIINNSSIAVNPHLLDNNPKMRPASAVELFSEWRNSNQIYEPHWEEISGEISSKQYSENLLNASKQLLFAGKKDEAYWLLVESLEEDPNNTSAIVMMNDFSSKGNKRLSLTLIILAILTSLTLLITAYLLGQKNSNAIIQITTNEKASEILLTNKLKNYRNDSYKFLSQNNYSTKNKLVGTIIPPNCNIGSFFIDNKEYKLMPNQKNITIPLGKHFIFLKDNKGKIIWQEHINLLPFQTKRITIPQAYCNE